jgi:hypothetical protein
MAQRCGYVFDLGTPLTEDRNACCWRPVLDGTNRCRWHLDADKSDVFSLPLRVEDDEPLVESVFRGAKLAGTSELAGRQLTDCDFSEADLRHADLSEADLSDSNFRGADLCGADLSQTDLRNVDLGEANLQDADLTDVDARGATFEAANLENASLVRANLRNATLLDAKLYEVSFSDTWINAGTDLGDRCVYEKQQDLELERDHQSVERDEAAAWTYRALERLARENALPRLTRHYYVREKDARRRSAWELGNYRSAIKAEASRWVMEYGSNPWRIVGISALVIVVSALLYPIAGGIQETSGEVSITYALEEPTDAPLSYLTSVYLTSLYFSVVTFATLGYGDIRPVGAWGRGLATVETIMGSLLIALLVFVLARAVTW